ncbi:TenA family transcriptional regulator [Endozoicomonas numazuensis]|uniref:Long-chain fatty acid--CoA ligase n=1 Tax=Endozoicomonas numazuensis TaxID=1137799 RepID=A0A081NJ86_9GAMM|nr:iron-containing redox enzyme family protein [Endozoicomonas numazuensis]KEQ18509.1 long-chain fatty acid--CoA ligase [Endozoicomonas numazuensis]
MNFFDLLQSNTELQRESLLKTPIIQRCFQRDVTLENYVAFLTQAYHHVKHTVPLLMAAGSRLPQEKEWLRQAIAEYIEEELGHQEWVLNDIAACGFDKEEVRHSQPLPETEIMVAYLYDTINRINPVGIFGMVQVLEGTSILLASAGSKVVQEVLELPDSAFSYLSSHGELDIGHMKFFENLMNKINDPQDQAAIIHCSRMMYGLYGNIFQNLDNVMLPDKRAA